MLKTKKQLSTNNTNDGSMARHMAWWSWSSLSLEFSEAKPSDAEEDEDTKSGGSSLHSLSEQKTVEFAWSPGRLGLISLSGAPQNLTSFLGSAGMGLVVICLRSHSL